MRFFLSKYAVHSVSFFDICSKTKVIRDVQNASRFFAVLIAVFFVSCSKSSTDSAAPVDLTPVINSVMPLSGPKNTSVTIRGTNFGKDISKAAVYFNGAAASLVYVNDTSVICFVPTNAGTGIIKVVATNGKTVSGPTFNYQYTGTVTTVAGSTNGFADGTGEAAQFGQSTGICTDQTGTIYMVDYYNSRVRKVTPDGVVTTVAGGTLSGYNDGTGSAALFTGPVGICNDGNGNFFIADTYNYTIRKMTSSYEVTTIAGSPQNGDVDGIGTQAKFYNPTGICVDAKGNLYITDYFNNKVKKVDTAGVVTTVAGSTAGYLDGPGLTAQFRGPNGICVDAEGNIYVSESVNNKIRKISPQGMVSTLAGSTAGIADGTGIAAMFNTPAGICLDAHGNIFVADATNQTLRMVTPAGEVSTVTGNPVTGNSPQQFFAPSGICMDRQGVLYVMDTYNYKIKKVTLD